MGLLVHRAATWSGVRRSPRLRRQSGCRYVRRHRHAVRQERHAAPWSYDRQFRGLRLQSGRQYGPCCGLSVRQAHRVEPWSCDRQFPVLHRGERVLVRLQVLQQVMAAVATLHPAIEVPDSRLAPFTLAGEAQLLADNACAHHFVLGQAAPDSWRTLDLSTYAVQARVERGTRLEYTREGTGANVLGDPRIALTWLVNQLSSLGITLQKGQVVTTGTCMVPLELEPGDTAIADYGPLGRVSMTFSD